MSNQRIIRVFLNHDPKVEVRVTTSEHLVRAKLKGIRADIYRQKFPRWAPFANQPQADKSDPTSQGWCWEFVDA